MSHTPSTGLSNLFLTGPSVVLPCVQHQRIKTQELAPCCAANWTRMVPYFSVRKALKGLGSFRARTQKEEGFYKFLYNVQLKKPGVLSEEFVMQRCCRPRQYITTYH